MCVRCMTVVLFVAACTYTTLLDISGVVNTTIFGGCCIMVVLPWNLVIFSRAFTSFMSVLNDRGSFSVVANYVNLTTYIIFDCGFIYFIFGD